MSTPTLRDVETSDFAAIAAIYAHHVQTGFGSFEEVPPSAEEMLRRSHAVRARGLPWRVAELAGQVVGYGYASPYHSRSAYRFTVQDSVYVAEEFFGRGVGTALVQNLLEDCAAKGYRQMMAVVGDSANEASLRLHARLGFRTIGQALSVGVKFGRWLDVVYMQRWLTEPPARPPSGDPIGYLPPLDQAGP